MATIHFIQQGKGGVGKSMIAVILLQVLRHLGKEVMAFDTDPVNSTLAGFKEFEVFRLDILQNGDIDPREFDGLINRIAELPEETHVIVDNGASSFLALNSYIRENDVLGILKDSGHNVYFHSVITGGQAVADTALGLRSLAIGFPDSPIVVWLNPYFGEIRMDDRPFEDFKVYQEFGNQFYTVITIPQGNKATLGSTATISGTGTVDTAGWFTPWGNAGLPGVYYWTGTEVTDGSGNSWAVHANSGTVYVAGVGQGNSFGVVCVP